jgi:arsenate reductase
MRTIFHLSTCDTCRKILKELSPDENVRLQDIKTEQITAAQLDEMARLAGSYEALFSRKAIKYRTMGLGEKNLEEKDYRQLILQEYTFLKRPVVVCSGKIFVGNAGKTVAAAAEALKA